MPLKIEIRKSRQEDVKSIKKMDDFCLIAKHPPNYFLKNLDNMLVAFEERRIVGYIMFRKEEVLNLVIHPDFRRKGIAKKMMKELMKKSKRLLCRTRENNQVAFTFLKNLGFKEKRRIKKYYKNGDNAIEMEWVR
jgi:ribosomal protein S18 acetylase RimI-like enzyme